MLILINVFRDSILITGLVMVMLLLIEFIHIYSQGRSFVWLQHRPFSQITIAALLGLVPGCIGGFAAVSLYTHGILSLGALVAMMVSTMGDEAFVLFVSAPKTGLFLALLFLLFALLLGWITDKWIVKNRKMLSIDQHYTLHHEEGCVHGAHTALWGKWRENLRQIDSKRALLLIGLLLFIVAMGLGGLEHDTHIHEGEVLSSNEPTSDALHIFGERWLNLFFTLLSIISLFLSIKASNHFVSEHLWGHIIKKHLLKIFFWTFGALLSITIVLQFLHFEQWIVQNGYIVLLFAALIGLIPESGPHLIFIALYASGVAPFSVLFTNFFIQEGHTALPLLAENKRAFFQTKVIKLLAGVALGSLLYFLGI